jgi:hypothetical protein
MTSKVITLNILPSDNLDQSALQKSPEEILKSESPIPLINQSLNTNSQFNYMMSQLSTDPLKKSSNDIYKHQYNYTQKIKPYSQLANIHGDVNKIIGLLYIIRPSLRLVNNDIISYEINILLRKLENY